MNLNVFEPLFNEEKHEYTAEGQNAPISSVTQILKLLSDRYYRNINKAVLMQKAHLGTAVHKCIEYEIQGVLDYYSVKDEWQGYFKAFKEWQKIYNPEFIESEKKLACNLYAGTIDCICKIQNEIYIIDWKTTEDLLPIVALQTAGYAILVQNLKEYKGQEIKRGALQLKSDGKFKFEIYQDKNDYSIFEKLLDVYFWSLKNGK